jgi:cytosine deaminase
VSLSVQPAHRQREVAEKVAAAGINVIALPHTNLFLQGREYPVAMPRAVTAVRALREAGVNVAAGADNLQDPFNPVGRGDPLETAGLMIMAAHALPADALEMVSGAARRAMGLGPTIDYVAVRASTVREAIAFGPADRIVVRNGARLETADGGQRAR